MKEAALARYAGLIGPRPVALYRLDRPEHADGGIRMLVVTSRVGIDNPYFYSVRERLPARFAQHFADEPLVLPGWSIRALQHVDFHPLTLVKGHDVARSYAAEVSESERLCRLLEAYCKAGTDKAAAGHEFDELRARNPALNPALAREALQGDAAIEGLDRDYAFERARVIDGYFKDLASMGFPYGALFPIEAYPHAARAAEASFVHSVVRNFYQVRRRIEEYVA